MKRKTVLYLLIPLVAFLWLPSGLFAIGLDNPIGWEGTGARVMAGVAGTQAYDLNTNSEGRNGPSNLNWGRDFEAQVHGIIREYEDGIEVYSQPDTIPVPTGGVGADVDVDLYNIKARIGHHNSNNPADFEEYLPPLDVPGPGYYGPTFEVTSVDNDPLSDAVWTAGGFFRDEVYFESATGEAGDISLFFNVHAEIFDGDGDEFFNLSMGSRNADGTNNFAAGAHDFWESQAAYINQVIQLDFIGVESGTWLPFSVGAWGFARNAEVDFFSTVTFNRVEITRTGTGGAFGAGDVGLDTTSGFQGLSRQMTTGSAVPEPSTILLLGFGLVGIAGVSRRKQN